MNQRQWILTCLVFVLGTVSNIWATGEGCYKELNLREDSKLEFVYGANGGDFDLILKRGSFFPGRGGADQFKLKVFTRNIDYSTCTEKNIDHTTWFVTEEAYQTGTGGDRFQRDLVSISSYSEQFKCDEFEGWIETGKTKKTSSNSLENSRLKFLGSTTVEGLQGAVKKDVIEVKFVRKTGVEFRYYYNSDRTNSCLKLYDLIGSSAKG